MWLSVQRSSGGRRRVEVTGERFVIGRADDCDLRLDDANASRWHAVLVPAGDGALELEDLGSANGTYVDGRRVERATLRGGEQLQIGDAVVLVTVDEPAELAETAVTVPPGASAIRQALHRDSGLRRALEAPAKARRVTAAIAVAAVGAMLAVLALAGVFSSEASVSDVVAEVAPSTALVQVLDGQGARTGTGSGWVLDSSAGLIVTNAHVLNEGERFRVAVGGSARPARILASAPCEDLAVLEVDDIDGLRSLALGSQAEVRSGDTVLALGYPGGGSLEDQLTSTEGIVSVVRTSYREPAPDVPEYPNVIQTDASLNPGNSGGPLVDLDGRLIGVNAVTRTRSAEGRTIVGQAYAIGIDRVREVVAELRQGRSIAWTGIGFGYPTRELLREQGLPPGIFVRTVVDGTPAAEAGLADDPPLIVSVNGGEVGTSLDGYCDAAGDAKTGDVLRLGVLRPGSLRVRTVELRVP